MQVMNNINFDVIAIFYAPSFLPFSVTTQFMFLEFVKVEVTATELRRKLHLSLADIISSAAMGKTPKLLHWRFLFDFFSWVFLFCSMDFSMSQLKLWLCCFFNPFFLHGNELHGFFSINKDRIFFISREMCCIAEQYWTCGITIIS